MRLLARAMPPNLLHMLLTRAAKILSLLAAFLLGLGPVHALTMDICKPALTMDRQGSGCDCESSGCQKGAPVFCGQCLPAISAVADGLNLKRSVDRCIPAFVADDNLGRTLTPPVPPPEMAA